MTPSLEAQAIIYGSYILYMIDALLDPRDKVKASTIRLKQAILAETRKSKYFKYVKLSNTAWSNIVARLKDDNYHIAIFDAVEQLALDNTKTMTAVYGPSILNLAANFALKQTPDKISSDILKESRFVTDTLIKETQKVVYDYLKENK